MAGAYPALFLRLLGRQTLLNRDCGSFAACRAGQPPIGLPIAGFGIGEQGFS